MQRLLSGFAAWSARRRRRFGHLFKGRFRARLIEGELYFWTVNRYLHLNPVRRGKSLDAARNVTPARK